MKLTRKNLAQLFDVSIRTITTWQSDPAFPRPEKQGGANLYDGPAVLRWWRDREIASLIETEDGSFLDLDQERARLAKAQRERVELELRVRREELVDAAGIIRQFSHASNVTRNSVLGVPTRIAPLMAAETDADQCYQLMITELENALSTLADRWKQHAAEAEAGADEGASNG